MCSNDVLKERISNMEKNNKKEHKDMKESISKIDSKLDILIDRLEDKFVMRKEFKAVSRLLWIFATILWLVWFFINK